ncbi:MAG: DHH family phosphoesterase [Culicoidibacterales bacterium]
MDVMKQIWDKIMMYDTIVIFRHVSPDLDAYGSQGGLAELIRVNFPQKKVHCVGEKDRKLSELLFAPLETLRLQEPFLAIVTDTANEIRIDNRLYKQADYLIKIDHHPPTDQYGNIQYVDTTASSASEIIFDLYLYGTQLSELENLLLPKEAKRLLYAGICGDTGRFLYGTSKKTLETAALLIHNSFDTTALFAHMYEQTLLELKFQSSFIDQIEMVTKEFAIVRFTKELSKQLNPAHLDLSRYIYLMANIKGIRAWILFAEDEDGSQIRVNLRGRGFKVSEIAEQFGGGGHPFASGVRVKDWARAEEIIQQVKAQL